MAKKKKIIASESELPSVKQNPLLERLVLGAILVAEKPDAIIEALEPDDFFSTDYRAVFCVIRDMRQKKQEVGLVELYTEMETLGTLSGENLLKFLAEVGNEARGAAFAMDTVRQLRKLAMFRTASHVVEIAKLALIEESDIHSIIDTTIEKLSETARRYEEFDEKGITYHQAAKQCVEEIISPAEVVKIFTGVEGLDHMTGGFRSGELVIITAETGTGKTLLAQQIRRDACARGYVSLFCSGEMWAKHLLRRELAVDAGIPPSWMREEEKLQGLISDLIMAAEHQCKRCRILDGELAIGKIRRVARTLKNHQGLNLLILDYDELIDVPGKDENEQLRKLVRMAKSIGMELDCAVLLISQLRKEYGGQRDREDDTRPPSLNRVYGSGAKIKHSSVIIVAERKWQEEFPTEPQTAAALWVLKNRDGATGKVEAKFNLKKLRFESVPQRKEAFA